MVGASESSLLMVSQLPMKWEAKLSAKNEDGERGVDSLRRDESV